MWKIVISFFEDDGVLCVDCVFLGKSKVSFGIISVGRKFFVRMEDVVVGKFEVFGEGK